MAEVKEEAKKEAKAAEAPAPQAEETKEPEKKPERKLEAFYPEHQIKDGTVFLKRRKGKPRFRKIVSKKSQAQLFHFDRGNWIQKSALPEKGPVEGLKWHLRNKWEKVEEKAIPKPAPAK